MHSFLEVPIDNDPTLPLLNLTDLYYFSTSVHWELLNLEIKFVSC